MRLFIAIPLSKKVKEQISNSMKYLQDKLTEKLKWVKKDNLHITLKYIGDIDKSKLANLK
ncbi:MAG: 2'-5' RNA ligase family protein, partial [Halanaerobiales bacterium]